LIEGGNGRGQNRHGKQAKKHEYRAHNAGILLCAQYGVYPSMQRVFGFLWRAFGCGAAILRIFYRAWPPGCDVMFGNSYG
jgi:hypothetical protein